ncbi:MAG: prepilin-type N-terminal cleavage/methylation domain-containing protein [Candidatus Saccharimonadales bacterium]
MKTKKSNSAGFTLIELLIVIIIIGILAAIAFVAYSGSQNKAHKAAAQSNLATARTSLGSYEADNSSFPATIGDFDNWLNSPAGSNNKTFASAFVAPYTYSVTPSGCGDTVAVGGAITANTSQCTGYSLVAPGTLFGGASPANDITVTN